MNYNDEQCNAITALRQYLAGPPAGVSYLLKGPAGTGKTTIMKAALENTPFVMTTAPTHKAVKVIAKMMRPSLASFSTLHSAMNMEPVRDHYGRQKFKRRKWKATEPTPIEEASIIIIDEISMVEDDLMKDFLEMRTPKQHVIMMGDEAQLPPVNHKGDVLAMPFRPGAMSKLEVLSLTKIMRQGEGSDILRYATAFREHREPALHELLGKEIHKTPRWDILPYVIDIFKSEEYLKNRDRLKIMGAYVATVDSYNMTIHRRIYPDAEWVLCKGEQIILQAPYTVKNARGGKIQNAAELVIVDMEPFPIRDNPVFEGDRTGLPVPIKYGQPLVDLLVEDEDGFIKRVTVPKDTADWNNWLESIRRHIDNSEMRDKRMEWNSFYRLKDFCADWKHGYAITVHKSQGSTYQEAAIDMADLNQWQKPLFWRLAYTAATRPSQKLIIVA